MQECLVVIFNHRYESNIAKIRKLYGEKFHKIVMLMPFYDGTDPDVISVYESSYQFEGYLIQAYEKLSEIDAERYIFIADDMCLNPELSEGKIEKALGLKGKKIFIPGISNINSPGKFQWSHSRDSSVPFFQRATRWKESVPSYIEAMKRFEDFNGEKYNEEYTDEFFNGRLDGEGEEEYQKAINSFLELNRNTRKIPYPMAAAYSDFFVIAKEQLFPIARLCGVFSAMNMFVEIAIPTAIVLTTRREDVVLLSDTNYKVETYWNRIEKEKLADENHRSIEYLYKNWDPQILFIHPIKLSKWSLV